MEGGGSGAEGGGGTQVKRRDEASGLEFWLYTPAGHDASAAASEPCAAQLTNAERACFVAIVDGQSCGTRADTLSCPAGSCVRLLHMGSGGVKVQPIIGEQPDQPKTGCDSPSNFVPSNRPQNSTPLPAQSG